MKKIALISSLILAAVIWLWIKPASNLPADAQSDQTILEVLPDGSIEDQLDKGLTQLEEPKPPAQQANGFAKSLTRVPANPQPEQVQREIDLVFQKATRETLESALEGNVENAVAFSQLTQQCSGSHALPQSEEKLKDILYHFSQRSFNSGVPQMMGNGEFVEFESFEQYEKHMWKRFDQCNSTNSVRNNDLRERITRLAENGHVAARYLYATWPPAIERFKIDSIVNWFDYQNQALEFTWLNMEEGEPLGLLAYAQSFESIGLRYFTPHNSGFGQVFLLAAKICGLNSARIDEKLSNIGKNWKTQIRQDYFEQMQPSANELSGMFCN